MKMEHLRKGVIGLFIIITFFIGVFKYTFIKAGTLASPENSDYEAYPPFSISGSPPLVMLNVTNDYKMLTEAYNDTIDLDGDGIIDVSYKNNIDYYGYFDPFKCYSYSGGIFTPTSKASSDHYCSGTTQEWSGNFLNWLAMSRVDTLRRALYGGKRITDNSSTTILGGENIPNNALSWGKEYTGSDSRKLTPYDPPSGAVSSVCTAPSSSVTWTQNINSITNPILKVTYTGGTSTTLPTTETQIFTSYNLCGFSGYSYVPTIDVPNTSDYFPQRGNFYFVTEFQVTSSHTATGFPWKFNVSSIGTNDVAAVYVDGAKVADYLNGASHAGQINLNVGWHRLILVHRDNQGTNDKDGVTLSYVSPTDLKYVCSKKTSKSCSGTSDKSCGSKGPCIAASPSQQSTTYKVFGSDSSLNLRAPYLGADTNDACRLKHANFISTGEPQSSITVDCGGGGANNRHLFCITDSSTTSKIRVLTDVPYRAWNWASVNGSQCGNTIDANNDGNAETPVSPNDFDVKVEVCKSSIGLESNCKKYGSNYKPVGLLQKHGEGDANNKVCSKTGRPCTNDSSCTATGEGVCIIKSKMYFGLITGARENSKAGGVLRKNIWSVMNEVVDTTGILNTNTDNTNPGTGVVAVGHIINAINNINWTNSSNMWGNPVAEMMYEATRYLLDKGQSTSTYSSGVTSSPLAGWLKPYSQIYPSCSKPFVVTISDPTPSYDSDQLPGSSFGSLSSDIPDLNVSTLADLIGAEEGINGRNFVIGQFSTNYDMLCSNKGPINLSKIRGLCPEEPTKGGSYYSASIAYYGHTKGSPQPIGYYSFVQPSKLPSFDIKIGNGVVSLSPLAKNIYGNYFTDDQATTNCYNKCSGITTLRADGSLNLSGCSSTATCENNQIADVYIENIEYDNNKNIIYASYRVGFDDAQELTDFDMDSIVKYEIITKAYLDKYNLASTPPYSSYSLSNNQVLVHIKQEYASSGYATALGFTIAGTTEDNYYLPLRDDNTTPSPFNSLATEWFKVFTVSGTSSGFLKDPLWYAAKWGSFVDKNGNQKPDLQDEWDQDHNGIPDAYFLVSNPLQLEQKLEEVFLDILKRTSSGTAVSVLASSAEGEGALYQAFFKPVIEGDYGPVKWAGFLQGLFVDPYGNIREDTNKDNRLTLTIDRIVKFRLDDVTKDTVADLYADTNGDGVPDGSPIATVQLTEIKALWEAGKELAKITDLDRNIFTSTTGTEGGRLDFSASNVSIIKNYLGPIVAGKTDPEAEATNVINFVRGKHVDEYRNRYVTVDGQQRVWKLSDIVYSTPTIVSAPSENYDLIYGDKSYFNFYNKYKNRMAVVYAGSNDGILHAFYSGTYHQGDDPSTTEIESGWFEDTQNLGFGKELWGFIPKSFLPHLYWQTQDDYRHVFGVDLKPKIVDLKIFTPDSKHIDGWGTVLIGGMRLGGGAIKKFDSASETIYPSYFAIDITDPMDPKLLWEFSHPQLGMTLSYPAVVKKGDSWYAIFGSGPFGRDPNTGDPTSYKDSAGYYCISPQTAKIFIVDIKNGGNIWTQNSNYWILDTNLTNAFMGSPVTLDYDLDFSTDVIYVGSATGTTFTSQGGVMYRIITDSTNPSSWKITKMFTSASNSKPLLSAPAVTIRSDGSIWIYESSGRFLHKDDAISTNQEKLYGFKDPCFNGVFAPTCSDSNMFTETKLADVSNIVVKVTGDVDGASALTGKTTSTFDELKKSILFSSYYGWMANMTETRERGVAKPALIGDIVLYTTFTPTGDVCGGGGHGNIYALYSITGTAYNKPIIGTSSNVINKKLSLSSGTPSSISIHMGREKGGKAYIQQSTGEILSIEFQTAAQAKSGYILWREKW
ncbi:MAG: PilC/PilY family type IV pilus protein [bacterium]